MDARGGIMHAEGSLSVRQSQQANTADAFLCLISSPFSGSLGAESVIASLVTSLVLASAMALLFCLLRPYNSVVYAPRAKHADSKHAPPPISKTFLGWVPPLLKTKEQDLVERVGLDAAIFLRISRMMRWMFLALAIIGCGILLPVNIVSANIPHRSKRQSATIGGLNCEQYVGYDTSNGAYASIKNAWIRMTPQYTLGGNSWWAYVVVAYLFDGVIMFFLWSNYRVVLRLRRAYFNSPDYQQSLHARTLMLTDIPKTYRSDDGIIRIAEETRATQAIPRPAIARNVKELPDLVEEHENTVRELEEHLAKYLRNPDRLPVNRPTTKASKNDAGYNPGQRVDAIDYLTARIRQLERQIHEVRESVDKRNALSYGFASYERISEAHSVAYATRKKGPEGTTVKLAPKPNDLVWKNLKMSRGERSRQNIWNGIWIGVLTVVWIVPNILIAVFLSNISHIALLAPGFRQTLQEYPKSWAVVQGVAAPAITTLFYFYLPAIFRRLCMNAGDVSKTSRERHVMRALYSFFTFNNLIVFSLFSVIFTWIAVIASSNGWNSFVNSNPLSYLVTSLCSLSPYWISWMLQRNLGSAVDLSLIITLVWNSISRRFLSPTPRRLIELSAPQAFDYAGYYNYYLFYATVAMTFAGIQPLVIPVTALYFWLDSFFKKYLILYVFITKYESGGMFWRPVFNRMLFLTILSNVVFAVIIAGRTIFNYGGGWTIGWQMLVALIPLPIILTAFKFYCSRAFDDQLHFYHVGQSLLDTELAVEGDIKKTRKGDRVGVRFGHPVLYKPLITPMVSAKSQHLLKQVYSGRTTADGDAVYQGGFSDVHLDNMDARHPGKSRRGPAGFEFVNDSDLDFENYKNRPEFREQAGGDGVLYGRAEDMVRPGTPGSSIAGFTRAGTWDSNYSGGHDRADSIASSKFMPGIHSRDDSGDSGSTKIGGEGGVEYPRGYHPAGLRDHSPADDFEYRRPSGVGMPRDGSRERLVATAAGMGHSGVPAPTPGGYGPIRMGGSGMPTPGSVSGEEDTSYDYFRRGRTQGR